MVMVGKWVVVLEGEGVSHEWPRSGTKAGKEDLNHRDTEDAEGNPETEFYREGREGREDREDRKRG